MAKKNIKLNKKKLRELLEKKNIVVDEEKLQAFLEKRKKEEKEVDEEKTKESSEDLEAQVLDNAAIDFSRFIASGEKAPVLEQVEKFHNPARFGGLVRDEPSHDIPGQAIGFEKYSEINRDEDNKKYLESSDLFRDTEMVSRTQTTPSLTEVGKDSRSWQGQEVDAMAEMKKMVGDSHDDSEYVVHSQRFDEKELDSLGKKKYDAKTPAH